MSAKSFGSHEIEQDIDSIEFTLVECRIGSYAHDYNAIALSMCYSMAVAGFTLRYTANI